MAKPIQKKQPGSNLTWPLLMALVAFIAYAPSLKSGLVYDARGEILEEGFVTSLANLPAVLSLKVLGMNLLGGFRPGEQLYLMLTAAVWGENPFGFHLGSNLLHAANAALLFVLLRRLLAAEKPELTEVQSRKTQVAIAAVTLIFALHPITVESVAEVSYSSALLVTFFTLLALLAATAFPPENSRRAFLLGAAGVVCTFSAVACKESGLTTVFLLIAYRFLFRRDEPKAPWLWFLGAAMTVTAGFLAARFLLAPPGRDNYHYLGGSLSHVFLIQPRLWVFMMGKLIWPTHLSADYTLENADGISTSVAVIVLVLVAALQLWLAAKSRIGAFGVAIYWLGLVTVSNFIPLYRPLADRFYYLPLVGVAMQLLALLLLLLPMRGGFEGAVLLCLAALVPFSLLSVTRQAVFVDNLSLWLDTLRVSPYSFTAWSGMGTELLDRGQPGEALSFYRKALAINPRYAEGHNNLGLVLSCNNQLDEAVPEFQAALAIAPYYTEARNNLGVISLKKGQLDDAIVQFHKALEINPNDVEANYNLGIALFRQGRVTEAIAQFRKSVEINPDNDKARTNLGIALEQAGQIPEAITQFQTALQIDPTNAVAKNNLATVQAMLSPKPPEK